jgi:hypothetical protein
MILLLKGNRVIFTGNRGTHLTPNGYIFVS